MNVELYKAERREYRKQASIESTERKRLQRSKKHLNVLMRSILAQVKLIHDVDPSNSLTFLEERMGQDLLTVKDHFGNSIVHLGCGDCFISREVVEYLVELDSELLLKGNADGKTPFYVCVEKCIEGTIPAEVALYIIQRKPAAVLIANETTGMLPIHVACASPGGCPVEIIRAMLQAFPEIVHETCPGFPRDSLLHMVCRQPQLNRELVVLLESYDKGGLCRLNAEHRTPLTCHLATGRAESQSVTFLVELDHESAKVKDDEGCLPVHIAMSIYPERDEIAFDLLDAYPEAVWVKNNQHVSPCDTFHSLSFDLELFFETPERCIGSWLPLHNVCSSLGTIQNRYIIQHLCKHFPRQLRRPDASGRLPLHLAMECQDCTAWITKELCEACPCALAVVDKDGQTPLHVAVESSQYDAVLRVLLLHFPLAVHVQDVKGRTPIEIALQNRDYPEILALLLDAFDRSKPGITSSRPFLHYAIQVKAPYNIVDLLMDRYPDDVESLDERGCYPLNLEMKHCNPRLKIVSMLCERFPSAITNPDDNGQLPLELACAKNMSLSLIFTLLQHAPECIQYMYQGC